MKSVFFLPHLTACTIFALIMTVGVACLRAQTGTVSVDATACIYGAGNAGNLDGSSPVRIHLASGTSRILTFTNVSGTTSPLDTASFSFGPDGGNFYGNTVNITSFGGISGVIDTSDNNCFALMGVVTAGIPTNAAPPSLDVTTLMTQVSFSPMLYQQFYIGDGLTGTGTGQHQTFEIPDQATDLYLGFADAASFQGTPGAYGDDSGSVTVTYSITGNPPPIVNINRAVWLSFSNLVIGTNYQVQVSTNLNGAFTNYGSIFTATNSTMQYPAYWTVNNWHQLYFRLQVSP